MSSYVLFLGAYNPTHTYTHMCMGVISVTCFIERDDIMGPPFMTSTLEGGPVKADKVRGAQ